MGTGTKLSDEFAHRRSHRLVVVAVISDGFTLRPSEKNLHVFCAYITWRPLARQVSAVADRPARRAASRASFYDGGGRPV